MTKEPPERLILYQGKRGRKKAVLTASCRALKIKIAFTDKIIKIHTTEKQSTKHSEF